MSRIRFDGDELTLVVTFAARSGEETRDILKGTLGVLEDTKEEVSDEEMILLLSSTIEKVQQVEDDYFYFLDLREYLNNIEKVDDEN